MRNLEGESDRGLLRAFFDRRLKFEFHGSRITSDAGLLAYRELDEALGLTTLAGDVIADSRTGKNGWHGIIGLLRQSVYGRLAGYEDVNDADRLGRDPAMRWIVGGRAVERGGASTSQMGRFETELLATNDNLAALADLLGIWIDQVNERKPPKIIVLDMDSSVSPTYGDQEGTAYNGHFGCTCYHPLFVFNQFGDLERCALRPGNVHSAHEWRDVLDPVVARYRNKTLRRYFRGDAAFASPEVYEFLEAEGFKYAIRLPANKVLHDSIAHLLKRPVGRPPKEVRRYYANFSYRAGSWTEPRRVVAKVEWHSGELYPRVGRLQVFTVDRRRKFVGITRTSAIGPVAGRSPAGSSPRWSGTRHQPEPSCRAGCCVLQSARHCRAMDQGRQERHQVDAAVMPFVTQQCRPAPAACTRL